jgi:NTE family protein
MFFSLRFEAGAAWKNAVKIKAEDFVNGRGVCLAMNTPLGPLQLSYGLASNNKKRLYFSFGHSF